MEQRLQKLISAAGLLSRRAAEEAIRQGRVTVCGETAVLGQSADPDRDTVCLDGKQLSFPAEKQYIMLHKPRGYVTTLSDERGRKTAADLVADTGARLYPVGRLDMDSEGLLLFTNDGELANKLMHPSHGVLKEYRTWVAGADVDSACRLLGQSMVIDGYTVRPAGVELLERFPGGALLSLTIGEGRNRQIRKMCALAGLQVTRLQRVAEGELRLGELEPGKWRRLTFKEIEYLQKI